jgi:hypothetical protein
MECLITSWRFENIIHMELDSTLTNNEAIGNVAIAKREEPGADRNLSVLVRSRILP